MKYFSMFSGIGGFELGIQKALDVSVGERYKQRGLDSATNIADTKQEQVALQQLCIGYSEIDKYAIKVYERQFNGDNRPNLRNGSEKIQNNSSDTQERKDRTTSGHYNYGDATKIVAAELPDFDLLVGGFPCQAFSIAGKRAGFNDTRGTLFFDIARILKEKRPRHLVLENVKGLLSHDSGKTFQTILGVLSDLGYRVEWQVLNSKDFGVPQNRERIYFVGHLGDECGRKVFPITSCSGKTLEQLIGGSQGNRVYSTNGVSSTLASQAGGLGAKTGLYAIDMTRRSDSSYKERKDSIMGTVTATYYKGIGNAERPGVLDNARIRRLTPLECERLQGFPDNWTAGESDTQRYKMCGNAVTVNVVEAVITKLIDCLVGDRERLEDLENAPNKL